MRSVDLRKDKIREMDAVVIVTDHSSYDYDWIVENYTTNGINAIKVID